MTKKIKSVVIVSDECPNENAAVVCLNKTGRIFYAPVNLTLAIAGSHLAVQCSAFVTVGYSSSRSGRRNTTLTQFNVVYVYCNKPINCCQLIFKVCLSNYE